MVEPVPPTPAWLGYRHPDYARSLAAYGNPRHLLHADGWVLERDIPGSPYRDAMGIYPLFYCRDWQALPDDIQALRKNRLVSLVLASDPRLDERGQAVFRHFDLVRPFKTHYLAELGPPAQQIASRHHRYYARRAAKQIEVTVAERPSTYLDEWCALYERLVARHAITDMRAFSRAAFDTLLRIPGCLLFLALRQGRPVGGQIVLLQDDLAHAHLSAFTDEGYRYGASYLLDWHALEYLRDRAACLNWGGGTGAFGLEEDGLARYKQGWSTHSRVSYLLGKVLDRTVHDRLYRRHGNGYPSYFPPYRRGEFGTAVP